MLSERIVKLASFFNKEVANLKKETPAEFQKILEEIINGMFNRNNRRGAYQGYIYELEREVDYRYYRRRGHSRNEGESAGHDERQVNNAYEDTLILRGYAKRLYDFFENQGFRLSIARGADDGPKGLECWDYIKISLGNV